MNVKKKLGFIGAGNMAEALARGLVENKVFKASELIASDVDAARRRKFKGALKIEVTTDNLKVLNSSRAVLFAVKPQTIDAVLTELARAAARARATAASRNGGLGAQALRVDRGRGHAGPPGRRAGRPRARDPRDAERARDGWSGDGGAGARTQRDSRRRGFRAQDFSAPSATRWRSRTRRCSTR